MYRYIYTIGLAGSWPRGFLGEPYASPSSHKVNYVAMAGHACTMAAPLYTNLKINVNCRSMFTPYFYTSNYLPGVKKTDREAFFPLGTWHGLEQHPGMTTLLIFRSVEPQSFQGVWHGCATTYTKYTWMIARSTEQMSFTPIFKLSYRQCCLEVWYSY